MAVRPGRPVRSATNPLTATNENQSPRSETTVAANNRRNAALRRSKLSREPSDPTSAALAQAAELALDLRAQPAADRQLDAAVEDDEPLALRRAPQLAHAGEVD